MMVQSMAENSRYLTLTQANLHHGYIYLRTCMDIFPRDAVGGSNKSETAGRTVNVDFGSELVQTDVVGDKKVFRDRASVRRFFSEGNLAAGHRLLLEQLGAYSYRVTAEPLEPFKCLSIQRPWANLILKGKKCVENRNYPWPEAQDRLNAGEEVFLGIHVGPSLSIWNRLDEVDRHYYAPGWSPEDKAAPSSVVGAVQLVRINRFEELPVRLQSHRYTDRKYKWHWVFSRPQYFLEPFKARGKVRVFDVNVPRRLLPTALREAERN